MSDEKKPRKKNVKLSGQKAWQAFTDRDVQAFDTVMAYAAEIHEAVKSHSPVTLSSTRLTKLDFLVALTQCAEKNLNRGLLKNFRKELNGIPIGPGSRRMLIAKLAKKFRSAAYGLYPISRFFCPTAAYEFQLRKWCENLKFINMTPGQVKQAVKKFTTLSQPIDGIGVRRYEDAAPLVRFESEQPEIVEQHTADAADSFARQATEYTVPTEEVFEYSPGVSYTIKTCKNGHNYSVLVGKPDEGCIKCKPQPSADDSPYVGRWDETKYIGGVGLA